MFLLIAFVFGFGMASTIYVAQSYGRGDIDEARCMAATAVCSFVPIAVLIAITGWFGAPWLLKALGTSESLSPLALTYLRVVFVSMPAMLIFTLLMMAFRGTGDSTTPLWFIGASVVIDSALNPVLILGLGPLPELGIAGAGLATVIAQYVSLVAMLFWIYRHDLPLRLRGAEIWYLKPDIGGLRTIVSKGLSIGAGHWQRVNRIAFYGIAQNVLLTGMLVVLLMFFAQPALRLFLGASSEALPIAIHVLRLSMWGFVAFGVALVLFGTVRANGQVVGPLVILAVAMYPVRLCVGCLLMNIIMSSFSA